MTAATKVLTEQHIRDLCDDCVFQRGYQYFNEGRASVVSQTKGKVGVVVQGSQDYAVQLKHTSKQFEASCDCPAACGFDFCKHCVAASLLYLELQIQKESLKKSSGSALLEAYLTSLPKEHLVNALAEHIGRNPITLQNWMLRAETAAEKLDARALKKHITAAIPYNRHLHRYPQVQSFFKKIEALLERLELEISHLDADDMLKLVDYAISRIRRALETVDDSGGFRYPALDLLAKLHRNSLQLSQQSSPQKANYLLRIYLGEENDFYPDIPGGYTEAVGNETLNLFYQRLHQRWEALPALDPEGEDLRHFDRKLDYLHTLAPLLNKARADNDQAAEIRYLEKSATNVRDMVALSALHADSESKVKAHSWLEKAEKLSEESGFRADRASIVDQKIELLILEKKPEVALKARWQHFTESLTYEGYILLRDLAERIGDTTNWYERSVILLQENDAKSEDSLPASDLVRIHLIENQSDAAIKVACENKLPPDLLEQIAISNATAIGKVMPLIDRAFEFHANRKNLQGYEAAVSFLQKVYAKGKKKDQKHLRLFATEKMNTHKPKKNLISLLRQAFEAN